MAAPGADRPGVARRPMRDSHAVAYYTIDPERSSLTVVARPRLTDGPGATVRSVAGTARIEGDTIVAGSLDITLDGEPAPTARIDLAATATTVGTGPDGEPVLVGRADRPAGAFGLSGPPLLNPTLQLHWRLVLRPD